MKLKPKVHVVTACKNDMFDRTADEMLGIYLAMLSERFPIQYGRCSGTYGGVSEVGYIVVGMTDDQALDLAFTFDQESVLVVDGQRMAYLLYADGRPDLILGRLIGTPTEPTEGDYTYSPVTGAYYYTRGVPYSAGLASTKVAA